MIKMKMTKSNNNEVLCPECGSSEVVIITDLSVDALPAMRLHEAVGEVYQCQIPDCMSYFLKVKDKFEYISKFDLIKKQNAITVALAAEAEAARAMLVPSVVEAEIAGRTLSPILYNLTVGDMYDRAYTVKELLDACKALGIHPSNVDNDSIVYVVSWLREHKDENKGT